MLRLKYWDIISMLSRHCFNVGSALNFEPWMLRQHHFDNEVTLFQCLVDIDSMLVQLQHNVNITWFQCCGLNIDTTLFQWWGDIVSILAWHFFNVISLCWCYMFSMLKECCFNVELTLIQCCLKRYCFNVGATSFQCRSIINSMLRQHKFNVKAA